LAIEIGLAPVMERFALDSALGDARWPIFNSSLVGLGLFFPFGSGIGTYPEVFRRFQPDAVGRFVNHAHNDYIEFLFEGGLLAAVILCLLLFYYARRWPALLRTGSWDAFHFLQIGAGISLMLLSLHGLTDYNWHIPANAIYFAFLAAVFFHHSHGMAKRADHAAPEPADKPPKVAPSPQIKPTVIKAQTPPGKNPFSD
jgi:hypothetical protein